MPNIKEVVRHIDGTTVVEYDDNSVRKLNEFSTEQTVKRTVENFKSSLERGTNFRSKKFTVDVEDYAVGVIYHQGSVVKNAGNLYTATGSLYFTSSVAPTGTGNGKITDGSGAWLYLGKYNQAMFNPENDHIVSFVTVPGTGLTRYDPSTSVNPFLMTGGVFEYANAYGGGSGVIINTSQPHNYFGATRFMTDSPILYMNPVGKKPTNSTVSQIIVNGYQEKPFCGKYTLNQSLASDPFLGVQIEFETNSIREIFYEFKNQHFGGVSVPVQYSVWKPSNPHRYRLMVNGDSFMDGGSSGDGGLSRGQRLANMLGCDDVWSTARGNTGFIWAGSGRNFLQDSIIDYTTNVVKPDIIYSAATDWDVPYTSAERKSAYKQYFDKILNKLPNCIIIVAGSRSSTIVENDMKQAVSEYNQYNVIFVENTPDSNGSNVYTGNGSVINAGTVQGNTQWILGGRDSDEHPNMRGNEYLAERDYHMICDAISKIK